MGKCFYHVECVRMRNINVTGKEQIREYFSRVVVYSN